jgi:hypothetical protein
VIEWSSEEKQALNDAVRGGTMPTGTMPTEALREIRHDFDLGNKTIWEKAPENTEAMLAHIAALEADLDRVAMERDTARQLHGALILEASAQVAALEKEIAALKAAGAVLSAHVDKTTGEQGAYIAGFDDGERHGSFVAAGADGEPSEAQWEEAAALQDAHDRSAEAMRAACWEAIQALLSGETDHLRKTFKAAIEGVTP